jgi:hypothetical protein
LLSFEHELSGRGEMYDHHGNLIDFHTQFSNVVEATEVGTAAAAAVKLKLP